MIPTTEAAIFIPPLLRDFSKLRKIRKEQIAACLEAMCEERRFTYTDLFIH